MSTPTPDSVLIAVYKADLLYNDGVYACAGKQRRALYPYCMNAETQYTAPALIAYEYLITLQYEYEYLWQRKWTAATWLFLANRYLMLAFIIEVAAPADAHMSQLRPRNVPQRVSRAAHFHLGRVFAMLDRAYITAGCVLLLGVAPAAIHLYQYSHVFYYYVDDPVLGSSCYSQALLSPSVAFHSSLAAVVSTIAADVIAIVTTWIKTYRNVRQATSIGMNASFSETLLRYGTMYFVILCVVHLVDLLITLLPAFQETDPVNAFAAILPNVIVCRFLINLRQVNSREASDIARLSQFSAPNFRVPTLPDIFGNLGEPLADSNQNLNDQELGSEGLDEGKPNEAPDSGDYSNEDGSESNTMAPRETGTAGTEDW
ncbi:hypothetical protein NM688_g2883 [Phlebia brevispora]|uniref:Uncharacterized protein n=1 Tax=Phlebia brevispora TaxID=194682 RepID=A0ACC1T745_9APHY|nr:hypothetical protein NM688_g2883 [Phlebia brevispora]